MTPAGSLAIYLKNAKTQALARDGLYQLRFHEREYDDLIKLFETLDETHGGTATEPRALYDGQMRGVMSEIQPALIRTHHEISLGTIAGVPIERFCKDDQIAILYYQYEELRRAFAELKIGTTKLY
jgi:hypothetical protein